MLLPGTRRQTPTQAVRTVAKQQETQAHSGKRGGGGAGGMEGGVGKGCAVFKKHT